MIINFEEYRKHLIRKECANSTIAGYKTTLGQLERFAVANGYTELSFELMLNYKRYMMDDMKYKDSTVNHKIISFSSYFNFLELTRCDFKASDYKVKRVKVQNTNEREYLVQEEYDALMTCCMHNETRVLMKLIAHTGLRITEAVNLTRNRILPNQIRITNKGKTRTIGMPVWLKTELNVFFEGRGPDEKLFSFSQTTYRNRMNQAGVIAGISLDKVKPHGFRHFFAKSFLEKNGGEGAIAKLQRILGHSDVSTTMIYLQYNNSEIAEFMMAG
ncbi:site-specific integrase [uncultured Vagococcus sp.]|uniref:tyrosine-type recombinase/integrase n=1 Tax=uncultured Vagococcus sp. TaxID=189676 RepID=UPI0028D57361|nr:site-specific integrase [uncultured Vagococcus sp.]